MSPQEGWSSGRRKTISRRFGAVATLAAVACVAPAAAQAAFPGTNGRIAFFGGPAGLVTANPDGSGLGKVTTGTQPAWSADGTKIAFGTGRSLAVVNADGTGQRLLPGTSNAQEPAWSPDGRQIVYVVYSGTGSDLYVINADGTGARALASGPPRDTSPAWSPDGTRIAFGRQSGSFTEPVNVHLINPDGTGITQITSNPPGTSGGDFQPNWSPDGQRLAVARRSGAQSQIQVINRDGSGRTALTAGPTGSIDSDPSWSPDGRQIAFERQGQTGSQINVMNADGTGSRQLIPGRGFHRSPDWGTSRTGPRPLTLTVTGRRRQLLDNRNRLHVFATCSKDCVVTPAATVMVGRTRVRNDVGTGRRRGALLKAGKRKKVFMKFLKNPARKIRKARLGGRRLVAKVEITATEPGITASVKVVRRIRIPNP